MELGIVPRLKIGVLYKEIIVDSTRKMLFLVGVTVLATILFWPFLVVTGIILPFTNLSPVWLFPLAGLVSFVTALIVLWLVPRSKAYKERTG